MIKNMGATRTEFGDGLKANAGSTLEGDLRRVEGCWPQTWLAIFVLPAFVVITYSLHHVRGH